MKNEIEPRANGDFNVNALGQPSPGRTDFRTWERATLERFAREAADENLILRTQLKDALAAWRRALVDSHREKAQP
jgi:hypothetical protein